MTARQCTGGWALAATLLLIAGCCGCSSFDAAWKDRAAGGSMAGGLAGRWQGTWISDASGHHDQLRCIISEEDPSRYQARFHAKYRKVFSFGYTVPLQVRQTNGTFTFVGDANLGWLAGGIYHYDGTVNGTNFFARYHSKYDHGTFQMNKIVTSP